MKNMMSAYMARKKKMAYAKDASAEPGYGDPDVRWHDEDFLSDEEDAKALDETYPNDDQEFAEGGMVAPDPAEDRRKRMSKMLGAIRMKHMGR